MVETRTVDISVAVTRLCRAHSRSQSLNQISLERDSCIVLAEGASKLAYIA